MKIFIAGTSAYPYIIRNISIPFVLESFYYMKEWQLEYIKTCDDFLLDSGAFTFMSNAKSHVDWEEYIEKYANFINKNNISKFFELDIDSVVGYDKVKEYRAKLEKLTNKQSIPVWHNNRGKDEFIRMCEEYPYVALGGLVSGSGEYSRKYWRFFPWFINTAHDNQAKIHALGFTSNQGLKKYHFDSVDSTSWLSGCRYGNLVRFYNGEMINFTKKNGKRAITDKIREHNLREWIKFQKYAETHL